MIIIQNFGFANWLFHCDFHAGADAVYGLDKYLARSFACGFDLALAAYGRCCRIVGPVAQQRCVSVAEQFLVVKHFGYLRFDGVSLSLFQGDASLRQFQAFGVGPVHFAEIACYEMSCQAGGDIDEFSVFLLLGNYVELVSRLLLQSLYCICLILSQISLP